MSRTIKGAGILLIVLLVFFTTSLFLSTGVSGMTEYSIRTNQSCKACHLEGYGGPLSSEGLEYAASGYRWPPSGGYRVLGPIKKSVRLVVGFVHVTAAFIWFGAILYVHLLLKPGYASKGLPKGEVIMGLISMILVGITGVLLTISRIRGFDVLYSSPWGIVLSIKIAIYVIMVSSALFTITYVGPRLKRSVSGAEPPDGGVYDPVTLSGFDGKKGRPAYIAYEGKVYNVSGLKFWRDGTHMIHKAGENLTGAIKRAPHGVETLDSLKVMGSLDVGLAPPKRPIEKVFYFVAYVNLALVFTVLFLIAYWRWGI